MLRALKTGAVCGTVMVLIGALELVTLPSALPRATPAAVPGKMHLALAFIINRVNPVDNISFQELRNILLGERAHWPNRRKITVVMQEQGQEEREIVLRQLYHMSEGNYSRYLLLAAFTGSVQSEPKVLSTPEGVVKFVSFVPGAIGYVYLEDVGDSVKVIKIDDLAPDQAGYKFRFKAHE
jgi:ABC-type phosphate transport system substrate-binding protein